MQPADTALTRMYNQPTEIINGQSRGLYYKNPIDCAFHLLLCLAARSSSDTDACPSYLALAGLWKTVKAEGFLGLYKGGIAQALRITPHTIITLVANEVICEQYQLLKVKISDE